MCNGEAAFLGLETRVAGTNRGGDERGGEGKRHTRNWSHFSTYGGGAQRARNILMQAENSPLDFDRQGKNGTRKVVGANQRPVSKRGFKTGGCGLKKKTIGELQRKVV